jgi:hypothetical protein
MKTEFTYPTPAEIHRIEAIARRERARAFASFLRWVFRRPARVTTGVLTPS